MAIEIVDFPINSMVIFHSYVKLPEGKIIRYMLFSYQKHIRIRRLMQYPLVNKQFDPENHQLLEETNLPIPVCQGLC